MAADCPFCASPNADHAIVCASCARDIAVPPTLLAERDNLIAKRAKVQEDLAKAKAELDALRRASRFRLWRG